MSGRPAHRGRGRRNLALSVALTMLCGACGVAESYRIALETLPSLTGTPCASTLGSYSLPKAHLQIKIEQTGDAQPQIKPAASGRPIEVVRYPDPGLIFCLDHLSSAFASDEIKITKWPYNAAAAGGKVDQALKTSFLGAVSVNALDQTSYIVNALLRSLFILATGDPGFAQERADVVPPSIVADLEFDPFNPFESAAANRRLTQLGYCLVLETHTFDTHRFNVDQYCGAPEQYGSQLAPVANAYLKAEATPANPHLPGLLYRPRHPYRLAIYRKRDPGSRGRWLLTQTTYVELENLSPVLSLAIERAAFAERTANFIFEQGTLVTACVSKTSEIEGFVEIPLEIAKSIVEVPGAIFKVRINQFKNQAELVRLQTQLYQVQQAYLEALTSGQFTSPPGSPTNYKPYNPTLKNINATAPGLAPRQKTLAYGDDLFGAELKKLCEGASS